MTKSLVIKKNESREWRQEATMEYIGDCDADKLNKLLDKHKIRFCSDHIGLGYYFHLRPKYKHHIEYPLKGFENLKSGYTYYVRSHISKEYNKKKDQYYLIGEIYEICVAGKLKA